MLDKRCWKCGRRLPRSCFAKDQSRKDGLYARCRECVQIAYQVRPRPKRVCKKCGASVGKGCYVCAACKLEVVRACNRKAYYRTKERLEALCVEKPHCLECGQELQSRRAKRCVECQAKKVRHDASRRASRPDQRAKKYARRKALRIKRGQNVHGVCTECRGPSEDGYVCRACLKMKRRKRRLSRICAECGNAVPYRRLKLQCDECGKREMAAAQHRVYMADRARRLKKMKAEFVKNRGLYVNLKYQALVHYSNGAPHPRCCACGYDTDWRALELDHINDDGYRGRGNGGGLMRYQKLLRDGYPPIYQTLCCNCNRIKFYDAVKAGRYPQLGKGQIALATALDQVSGERLVS